MRSPSDEPLLPINIACEIAGTVRQVRTTWIRRNVITGRTAGECTRSELIDLACMVELVDRLGFEEARLAWPQVASEVLTDPAGDVRVVVDLEMKNAVLARADDHVGRLCSNGHLAKVVLLTTVIANAAGAFERVSRLLKATKV